MNKRTCKSCVLWLRPKGLCALWNALEPHGADDSCAWHKTGTEWSKAKKRKATKKGA